MEAHLHHRWRAGADAAARAAGRRDYVNAVSGLARRHQPDGDQSARSTPLRHPFGLSPLHGDRRARNALAGAVLVDRAPAMCSSRWRRSSCVRTSNMSAGSPFPTRTRRASSSTPRRCSSATSSPATTASKAARAPMSACAIPAPTTMAGRTNATVRPVLSAGRPEFLRLAGSGQCRRLFRASRPRRPTMSASSASAAPAGFRPRSAAVSTSRRFEIRRAEVKAAYSDRPVSLSAKYAFIQAQPLYGFTDDRHEVTLGASTHLARKLARLRHRHLRFASKACWSRTASALPTMTRASPI